MILCRFSFILKEMESIKQTLKTLKEENKEGKEARKDKTSRYTERRTSAYGAYIGYFFMTILSGFLLFPLAYYLYSQRVTNNTVIDGKKLRFNGKVWQAFVIFFVGVALTGAIVALLQFIAPYTYGKFGESRVNKIVTSLSLAILTFLTTNQLRKWRFQHTHFDGEKERVSYLTFSLFKTLFYSLLCKIVGLLSVGMGYPAVYKVKAQALNNRRVIDGKRIIFSGKTSTMYGIWIRDVFLSVITGGLYVPILLYNFNQWVIKNSHIRRGENTMRVAITGASGSMGKETVKAIMESQKCEFMRILLLNTPKDRRYKAKVKAKYGKRVEVFFGDVRNYADCLRLTDDVDYVLHLAAVIPPKADHDEELTVSTNYGGTVNMVKATIENGNKAKFIHISTVALYGNRDEKHPWGRVGDPLLTSAFDVYGTSKLRGERYVLDSDLNKYAVLRQTGILYNNLLMNNISDGLMFHTPWNVPIEWATAKDSGLLLRNILLQDVEGKADDFWYKVYNIGDGAKARQTGYETFDDGFKLIGGSVKSFFEPRWDMTRNFHCFWFSDSDVLEEKFHFRTEGCEEFWAWMKKKHAIYGVAKILPASFIRKLVIEPLLKNDNAPMYWIENDDLPRVTACFGSMEKALALPKTWDKFDLLCERKEYEELKKYDKKFDLDHGYDESKKDEELTLNDMKGGAAFRGGEVVSQEMEKGDLYKKLVWRCHNGHEFEASPYTVLKAGHWCPVCCMPDKEWNFDALAEKIPFFAQLHYDTHEKEEKFVYSVKDNVSEMRVSE